MRGLAGEARMIAVLRSELKRTMMIRASWVSIAVTIAAGLTFGGYSVDFWTLFAGVGAFGLAVLTTGQHYQHRTAMLLFLGGPHRLRTLAAQCLAAAVVTTVTAALSGLTVADEPRAVAADRADADHRGPRRRGGDRGAPADLGAGRRRSAGCCSPRACSANWTRRCRSRPT